jgi:hypothetical protein
MKYEIRKFWERYYDGQDQGFSDEMRPNKYFGEFKIIKEIDEGFYEGEWIGEKDGKIYLIIRTEVSGMFNPKLGGHKTEIIELPGLTLANPEQ